MTSQSLASPPSSADTTSHQRLVRLLQLVESGQPVRLEELGELARDADRNTRGLAKRLLAHLIVQQAQRDGARLLCEACHDLDFRSPEVLAEALQQTESVGDIDNVYELSLDAAEQHLRHSEPLPAAIQMLNAGGLDFRHGSRHLDDPACIRRAVGLYERIAAASARALRIQPARRGCRRSPEGTPYRLAHIVSQLVDGRHAPSRVMVSTLKHADREHFQVTLAITDSLGAYEQRPAQMLASDWSARRAPQLIRQIQQEWGIPVLHPRTRQSLIHAAADLHRQLAELQIDIAFFHGSIAAPADWLLCAWQAAPWQFDYGFGVPLHCPAVNYQFFEYAGSMEKLAFLCRERNIPYGTSNFGGTDMDYLDGLQPIPRERLNIPANHIVLGNIGNHLPNRMSERFCRTIANVMHARPDTTYLVVGPGDFSRQVGWLGNDLCGGERPRVRFVGSTREPGCWTKAFDIYVNEYPAGGGVAVCEAMAACKPVVGMVVDQTSLSQVARQVIGNAHLVEPPTDQAYAARLTQLIDEPDERTRMGTSLRQRYETDLNGRKWAEDMHRRVYEHITGHE